MLCQKEQSRRGKWAALVPPLSVNASVLLKLLQRNVMNWSLISVLSRKNNKGVSPETKDVSPKVTSS